jgi:2-succinyl-5-enolpyruvyl-6-hydroxy-3-cyclohexene-1-carboxylate synthase
LISTENINSFWASLVVEELVRSGVTLFCISPGSRSAPLTVAAVRNPQAHSVICNDERGAAFFALGYAKATGVPAALISTSGTAAANYFPAVVEAAMDAAPMILLTADRPPELHETGANQTIRQDHLFDDYLNWRFTMPCPDDRLSSAFVLSTMDWAVARAIGTPPGPVHINMMFREPLTPIDRPFLLPQLDAFKNWETSRSPWTQYRQGHTEIAENDLTELLPLLNAAERPLLILGRMASHQEHGKIVELAQRLQWPTHIDIANPLRFLSLDVPAADEIALLSEKFKTSNQPDFVLHLGGAFLSKNLQRLLEASTPNVYIHIHSFFQRSDPGHLITRRIIAEPNHAASLLLDHLHQRPRAKSSADQQNWLDDLLFPDEQLTEPAVARLVSQLLPPDHALFLGNSMPVRDMHLFAQPGAAPRLVGSNRGASGIDGTIASAAGFARGCGTPTTLLIGDLALLHDLNSLLLVHRSTQSLTIIVLNNNGGGIFSLLPIARHPDVMEFFHSPHGLTFKHAAVMFGLNYEQPKNISEFIKAYTQAVDSGESTLIEVLTDKESNALLHQKIEKTLAAPISEQL